MASEVVYLGAPTQRSVQTAYVSFSRAEARKAGVARRTCGNFAELGPEYRQVLVVLPLASGGEKGTQPCRFVQYPT